MVTNFLQFFNFVNLNLSSGKISFVINVATLARNEIQPTIGTPTVDATLVRDSDTNNYPPNTNLNL